MKSRKRNIVIILIIISLFINAVQFIILKEYKHQQHSAADNDFKTGLQLTCLGINDIKTKKTDELSSISVLSAGTSKASTIYASTSYYRSNPLLDNTIWILNNNITNRTNIREVLDNNDLTVLIPVIKKVIDDPLDETATNELDYLVRKHTVIGSPLP
jgi:hypothetical protein